MEGQQNVCGYFVSKHQISKRRCPGVVDDAQYKCNAHSLGKLPQVSFLHAGVNGNDANMTLKVQKTTVSDFSDKHSHL